MSIRNYGGMAKPVGADKKRQARNLAEAIGALITDLRKKKGWSQPELAYRARCNESTIRILEMATKSPTLRTLEDVAGAFSMDVVALIVAAKRRVRT
jgi:transcriptional regulator with XRE-family HTH domain